MNPKWEKRLRRDSKCKECLFYVESYAGYEEGGHLEELECSKRPGISNLWSFPFLKPQKCFIPDFWHSEFAEQIQHGTDFEVGSLMDDYRKKYAI